MAAHGQKPTLLASFGFAAAGIGSAVRKQRNLKIHLAVAVLALIAAALLRLTNLEWAAIIVCIALVIAAELVNTAIESLTDLASPEMHPLAKRAKDAAAGAVLILALMAVVVGLIVYIPAFLRMV